MQPEHPAQHPAKAVIEFLAAQILEGQLQGTALVAAARLVCQDQWHREKLAQAEKKLAQADTKLAFLQEKETAAAKYRLRTLRLNAKTLQLKKKELIMKRKAELRRTTLAAANRVQMEAPPQVVFAPAPQPENSTALQHTVGIAPGGIAADARARKT